MASLYKRPEAETWQCQFYVKDPLTGESRKIRKSTGCRTKDEAWKVAADIELNGQAVMKAGSLEAQQVRTILAQAAIDIERKKFTGPAAHKCVAELLKAATGEELTAYTLETWSAEWLRRKGRKSSKATMARYRSHSDAFLVWLGDDRRKRPLESVTTQDVRAWQESLNDAGRAGKTVLSYVKDIGAIFRAAIRDGIVSVNPCGSVIPEIDTEDSMERKPFSMTEIKALMKGSPSAEWRGLILVAAYTGLRLGDAASLLWDKVDLEAKLITLIPSKTKKNKREIQIPIHDDLFDYLKALNKDKAARRTPVFPTLAKMSVNGADGLSNSFSDLILKAGVSRGKPSRVIAEGETKGKGRITWEKGFHSLRHTFTTWLRTAGVSEEDRMALTGHSTRESHRIYSHVEDSILRAAIGKLPGLTKKAKKPATGDLSASEISNIAANLPTGSPEERAKNAQLILEAVKRNTQPPPIIKAWHETVPLEELLDELMPIESPEDRTVRYCSFLKWLVKRQLKDEIDAQKIDNTLLGNENPEVAITEEMVMDLFRRTMEAHSKDGVMEAPAFAEKFKQWSAAKSKK